MYIFRKKNVWYKWIILVHETPATPINEFVPSAIENTPYIMSATAKLIRQYTLRRRRCLFTTNVRIVARLKTTIRKPTAVMATSEGITVLMLLYRILLISTWLRGRSVVVLVELLGVVWFSICSKEVLISDRYDVLLSIHSRREKSTLKRRHSF